jgi:ribosomal-protein-alanine N-acetyltransferase
MRVRVARADRFHGSIETNAGASHSIERPEAFMSLLLRLNGSSPQPRAPSTEGAEVLLRPPALQDYRAWAALRAESRDFLKPWEAAWPPNDLSRAAFRQRLRHFSRASRVDEAYPFFIFHKGDGALLGACTLSNVRRGIAQTASLGYWIGAPFARRGYMTQAMRALIPFAFKDLHLHRIEAACLPDNEASRRLLAKLGFREEGFARGYLRINGAWRDHTLFALLADDARR